MMKFLYGSTKNADMLYALGLPVYESAFLIDKGKEKQVFLDSLDFGFFSRKILFKWVKIIFWDTNIKVKP